MNLKEAIYHPSRAIRRAYISMKRQLQEQRFEDRAPNLNEMNKYYLYLARQAEKPTD